VSSKSVFKNYLNLVSSRHFLKISCKYVAHHRCSTAVPYTLTNVNDDIVLGSLSVIGVH